MKTNPTFATCLALLTLAVASLITSRADAVDEGGPSCRTFRIVRLGDVDVVCHEDAATELRGEIHRLPVSGDGLLAVGCVDVCQIAGRVAVPQMDVDGVEMKLQPSERSTDDICRFNSSRKSKN